METERYIVNFYSVGDKPFGITDVKKLWIAAALVEEAGCGVFINGVIESMELICDTIDRCGMDSIGVRIIATRNPVLCRDREVYYHAFRKIVLDVKKKLGNPYVTISMLNTNYFYFDSI